MNRIFKMALAIGGAHQVKQSYAPAKRRAPSKMPLIPLRSKRSVSKTYAWKHHFLRHVDDVKSIEINLIVITNLLVAIMTLAAGIGVVHFAYENRQQMISLSELRSDRDDLLKSWTYLMRDQNQLSEFSRIESTAMDSMNMHRPEKKDIYIMKKSLHLGS